MPSRFLDGVREGITELREKRSAKTTRVERVHGPETQDKAIRFLVGDHVRVRKPRACAKEQL